MFASPSFYLAHKISPSVPQANAFIHCIAVLCRDAVCVCVCAVHKVRDYVCAAGQSRNVESLGADNKKKREKKTSKKEDDHTFSYIQEKPLIPAHRGRLKVV